MHIALGYAPVLAGHYRVGLFSCAFVRCSADSGIPMLRISSGIEMYEIDPERHGKSLKSRPVMEAPAHHHLEIHDNRESLFSHWWITEDIT